MKTIKKMRKYLSLVLAAAIALSLFSGCSEKITDDEAAEAFVKGADILMNYWAGAPSMAAMHDFGDDYAETGDIIYVEGVPFCGTTLEYKDAEKKYSEVFCGDLYEDFMNSYFSNDDGVLFVRAVGGASGMAIDDVVATFIDRDGDEYNYKAEFFFVDYYEDENGVEKTELVPSSSTFSVKIMNSGIRLSDTNYFRPEDLSSFSNIEYGDPNS